MRAHEGPHDAQNPYVDPATGAVCFGCRVKDGFNLSSKATPTRTPRAPFRHVQDPSWEAGIAGEHRPGGGFMPYLNAKGVEMGVKEHGEQRRKVEAIRRQQRTDPNVFSPS